MGIKVKQREKASLITELPTKERILNEYVSDRCGRGLKHLEPEGTNVY